MQRCIACRFTPTHHQLLQHIACNVIASDLATLQHATHYLSRTCGFQAALVRGMSGHPLRPDMSARSRRSSSMAHLTSATWKPPPAEVGRVPDHEQLAPAGMARSIYLQHLRLVVGPRYSTSSGADHRCTAHRTAGRQSDFRPCSPASSAPRVTLNNSTVHFPVHFRDKSAEHDVSLICADY